MYCKAIKAELRFNNLTEDKSAAHEKFKKTWYRNNSRRAPVRILACRVASPHAEKNTAAWIRLLYWLVVPEGYSHQHVRAVIKNADSLLDKLSISPNSPLL